MHRSDPGIQFLRYSNNRYEVTKMKKPAIKYRTVQLRKAGRPLLLLLTDEEHEYFQRVVQDREAPSMAVVIRGRSLPKGWRRELDELRVEQGPIALPK